MAVIQILGRQRQEDRKYEARTSSEIVKEKKEEKSGHVESRL